MSNKVSIIIPVYNGSNYLHEAIESAIEQTYKDIEIIVVNDGSDDDGSTRRIALSYKDRIRYFEKENGGVSTALNYGIKRMRGDYFSWLSHDDLYSPDKIQIQMEALKNSGGGNAVYCDYDCLMMPNRQLIKHDSLMSIWGETILGNGMLALSLSLIEGCSLLIPKTFFDKYGLFNPEYRSVQDYIKWREMFANEKMIYVDRCMVTRRVHSAQQGKNLGQRRINEEIEYFIQLIDIVFEGKYKKERIGAYELMGAIISLLYDKDDVFLKAIQYGKERLRYLYEGRSGSNNNYVQNDWYSDNICLFCMGKRGLRLNHILKERGIKVTCFSDNDITKWGTIVDGVPCVNPMEIDKNSSIIVTKNNPDEIENSLKEQGFLNITHFDYVFRDVIFLPILAEYL